MPSLALYISPSLHPTPSPPTISSLLSQIRSTSYIDEVTSGETSREESGLWNAVYPFQSLPQRSDLDLDLTQFTLDDLPTKVPVQVDAAGQQEEQQQEQEQVEFSKEGYVVVDEQTLQDGSLLVVETRKGGNTLRVAARSLIEVASNVAVANMSLSEYRAMCGGAEVFDAGQ